MDRTPQLMKEARVCFGVGVDGSGVYARVMIPVDHEVCLQCLGSGKNYDINEICDCCNGVGTLPQQLEETAE